MKLRHFGLSAALVTAAIAAVGAPVRAANVEANDREAIEVAQRVGERPGDVCRMVVEASTLYADPDGMSLQIANMLENEMIHFMETVTANDGTVWFFIEDSVGNTGYMPAYMKIGRASCRERV